MNVIELEDRLAALESARAWSPRVVSRLESRIHDRDDLALFRINPLAYAAESGAQETEAVDLFLHAAHVGLFEMEWNIVCASCGNTARSFRSLEKMDSHFDCSLCQFEVAAELDDYIQVAFTIAPSVRRIVYHEPSSLEVTELLFDWHFSHDVRPTIDGKTYPQLLREWTRYAGYLAAGEVLQLELELQPDAVSVRDVLHAATALYMVPPAESGEETTRVELSLSDGRLVDADRALEPLTYKFANDTGQRYHFPGAATLPAGSSVLRITNDMTERAAIWVHEYPAIPEEFRPVQFEPVLTARRLLSTQTFRTLFRSQTLATSESLAVTDLTFLFTDLSDSTRMYDLVGDATAYNLVRRHFDALETVIATHGGAIVKTIGDAIMATFTDAASSVRAAIGMNDRLDEFDRTASADLVIKVGLHRGHAIAVTSNEQIDYFGQTVNIAARIQGLADSRRSA